jgi:hypothetical protein
MVQADHLMDIPTRTSKTEDQNRMLEGCPQLPDNGRDSNLGPLALQPWLLTIRTPLIWWPRGKHGPV